MARLHIIIVVFEDSLLKDIRIIKSFAIAIPWLPRSSDLNLFDFYFWGYAKDVAYQTAPTTKNGMIR